MQSSLEPRPWESVLAVQNQSIEMPGPEISREAWLPESLFRIQSRGVNLEKQRCQLCPPESNIPRHNHLGREQHRWPETHGSMVPELSSQQTTQNPGTLPDRATNPSPNQLTKCQLFHSGVSSELPSPRPPSPHFTPFPPPDRHPGHPPQLSSTPIRVASVYGMSHMWGCCPSFSRGVSLAAVGTLPRSRITPARFAAVG